MGLSETIVAAIIGALATMATAIVQLIRNRAPDQSRPKKNRMRSLLATIALMVGCIVGGYAWSALRAVSAKEDLVSTMQAEFSRQFAEFAARQNQPAAPAPGAAVAAHDSGSGKSEAVAQLPPCRITAHADEVGPVTCTDKIAQSIALCAAVPASSETIAIHVQARVPGSEAAWEERDAGATSLGSLHMGAAPTESPLSPEQRAVCLEVANHSVDDTLTVRLIVDYGPTPAPAGGALTASAPTAASL
jgi:hypothetical protein